jgi:hypothetical protein
VAVPYTNAVSVVANYGESLAGKILVDISNPFNADASGLVTTTGNSAAQEITAAAGPPTWPRAAREGAIRRMTPGPAPEARAHGARDYPRRGARKAGARHFPLRDIKRLACCLQLVHATPPGELPVDRTNKPRMTCPLCSARITRASPLLRAGPPAHPATVLNPSRFQPHGTLPVAALERTAVSGRAFSRSTRKQPDQTRPPISSFLMRSAASPGR